MMQLMTRFIKPFRWLVVLVLLLTFFQTLSDLYLPTLMSDIVDKGIVKGDQVYIWTVGGFMLLVAIGGTLSVIVSSYLASRVSAGFGRDLRSRLFTHVEHFSLREFDQFGTASLITRTTNDINQVQQVLLMSLRMMVSAPMMAIGGIIMAISKDAKLSLVLVAVLPILSGAIFIVAKRGIPLFKAMQIKLDKLNLVVREGLTGIRVVRSFNRTEHETKRFHEANLDLTETAIKVNQIMASLMPIMMVVMNLSTIAILWFGSKRVDQDSIQVGDLMAFLQYAMQIMWSLVMFSFLFVMIPRASASAVRINAVLSREPDIKDHEQAEETGSLKGYVAFQNVTFSYPGAEEPAIRGISFEASPGEVTAIIGGTGSGKSTLVNLIPRFYDIDSGRILVDGFDIRNMTQESLRKKIGFVPQTAVLFSGTVAENIRYGREYATDEEIRKAAETAQAVEFIDGMKEQFETEISQGGTNLSGGQKQRLSIARALVRRPEIYIFDDSFSALDFKTDAKLRAALKRETSNATVFIVAQRVSTVMDADRIIVLDEGEVAGIGSHKELMSTCSVYREIVSSQLSEEEIA